jgi:hypothetical protein
VQGQLADFSSTAASRGIELARWFGPESAVAYAQVRDGTLQLQGCLQLLKWRMESFPDETPWSHERGRVRDQCTEALRVIDSQRVILIKHLLTGLTDSRGARDAAGVIGALIEAKEWVTVDIKVNGLDDAVELRPGHSYTYTWSALDGTACQIITPTGVSGITRRGEDGAIPPGHPWYPHEGASVTLILQCTNGWATGSDSVVVALGA